MNKFVNRFVFTEILFLLLFITFNHSEAYGQSYDTIKNINSNYITCYKDSSLGIQILTSNKYSRFQLQYFPQYSKEKTIKFSPNESTHFGFGIDYKWFGIRLAFALPFVRNDDKKYGKTTQIDLQAHSYARKFVTDAYLQSYRGFYIENPEYFDPTWNLNRPYPSRQDIRTQSAGINCNYIFNNEKLSCRASFNQTEWQKKSAGSFLTGVNLVYYHLRSDSSIVVFPQNNMFSDSCKITNANIIQFGFTIGYVYTLVIKKYFFVTLAIDPGVSLQMSRTKTETHKSEGVLRFAFNGSGRVSAGFNGKVYYGGVMSLWDNYSLNSSKIVKFQHSMGLIRIYFGRRFQL